jgi:ribokinase
VPLSIQAVTRALTRLSSPAGDCFTAAFAVALLEGRPHREAMLFASAAAALCIQVAGAMPSMPSRQAVDAALAAAAATEGA